MAFADSGSGVFRLYVTHDFLYFPGIYHVVIYVSSEYVVYGLFVIYIYRRCAIHWVSIFNVVQRIEVGTAQAASIYQIRVDVYIFSSL